MHQFRGLRLENASAAELTLLQVSDHETAHVYSTRSDTTGRIGLNKFVGLRALRSAQVAVGHERLQFRRQRLNESGVRHAQRAVDVIRDVLFERLAGDALDNVAGQGGGIVGISGSRPWGENTSREMVAKIFAERADVRCIGNE